MIVRALTASRFSDIANTTYGLLYTIYHHEFQHTLIHACSKWYVVVANKNVELNLISINNKCIVFLFTNDNVFRKLL